MKQVQLTAPPLNITSIDEVLAKKYYGAKSKEGSTGFISQTEYMGGLYILIASRGLTYRNSWNLLCSHHLGTAIKNLLKQEFEVYEFDTPKELYTWLAENT